MRRCCTAKIVSGSILWSLAVSGFAQGYPVKPIRVVIPFAAGTGLDAVVRILAEPLSKSLGQPVIVENRTGASGTIGTGYVASSPADGYTMVAVPASYTTAPLLMKDVPYNPATDLAGVTTLAENPLVLVVNASAGIRSLAELVAVDQISRHKARIA